jgi:hypothetical protein
MLANSTALLAKMTEQSDLLFRVNTDLLSEGVVHYSFAVATPQLVREKIPDVIELDGGRILQQSTERVTIAKLAYVVDKPAGFFSEQQLNDPLWLGKLFGMNVTRISEGLFKTSSQKFQIYFDSDDLSSVRTSRFVHSVAQSKKLDPIVLGSFSTVVFHSADRVQVDNHVPLSPRKTLVVSYVVARVAGSAKLGQLHREFVLSTQERLIRAYP